LQRKKTSRPKVKAASLGVRISSEVKDALDRAAADDRRSTSSLVEKVLAEWLEARSYLGGKKPR
jgi:hypothetical protein